MSGRATATLACALLAAAASGCGDGRTVPPSLARPAVPSGSAQHSFPALGLQFRAAANWSFLAGNPPLVATMSSGQGLVAVWRYPRAQPLPRGRVALRRAREALIHAARARDPSFAAEQSRVLSVAGAPAVELLARETVQGQPRTVRSLHVYAQAAEVVVDASAPPAYFAQADARLFVPLMATLRVGAGGG